MPVPISVTHPKSRGLAAHVSNQLETEGPFARKQQAVVVDDAPSTTQAPSVAPQQQTCVESNGVADHEASVVVDNLNFSYPGLGAFYLGFAANLCGPPQMALLRRLFVAIA